MKITKRVTTRWVRPFGDEREEAVEIRRLTDTEVAAIQDKAGLRVGSDKNTHVRQSAAINAIGKASIEAWKGIFDEDGKTPLPCTDFNKGAFLDQMVEIDGERVSLWKLCWDKFEEMESAEAKN